MYTKRINKALGLYVTIKNGHAFYGWSFIEAINNALGARY